MAMPQPKAAWACVNLANSILLKMKLDLSSLYALYWHYLWLSSIEHKIISNCQKEVNRKQQPPTYGLVIDTINNYSWHLSWVNNF